MLTSSEAVTLCSCTVRRSGAQELKQPRRRCRELSAVFSQFAFTDAKVARESNATQRHLEADRGLRLT